jgi:Aminoglycoside-2''-adenylyltransferase
MTRERSGAFPHDRFRWEAWRPDEAQRLLAGVEAPWCVAAGWAIDLFLGAQHREHEDLEIAAPADRFDELVVALGGFELFVAGPDPAAPTEEARGVATPLAEAELLLETYHQTWVLDRPAGVWRMDVFREPSDGDTWICRRDESIRLPYDHVIERTPEGIPYARPEIVLLFKAKHAHRAKDRDDFAAALPLLQPERRRWLANALVRVHPGHAWLAELD